MFDKWKSPRLGSKIILENSRVLLLPFESERKSELKELFSITIFGTIWGWK